MSMLLENVVFGHDSTDYLETFEKASSNMSGYNINDVSHVQVNDTSFLYSLDGWSPKDVLFVNKTVKGVNPVKNKRGCYIRKRSWTSTLVTSLIDDGHTWRKYGQKEIINAKHKRNYYRCTHKFEQGCKATKQVQKIEDEPPKYKITYNRHHSCKDFLRSPQITLDSTNHNDTSILLSFESNEVTNNERIDPYFPLNKHNDQKDVFSSLELKHNEASPSDYNRPNNHFLSNMTEPMSHMSRFEQGDVISTGVYSPVYEIGHILETNDFSKLPFDFTQCELTDLYYL